MPPGRGYTTAELSVNIVRALGPSIAGLFTLIFRSELSQFLGSTAAATHVKGVQSAASNPELSPVLQSPDGAAELIIVSIHAQIFSVSSERTVTFLSDHVASQPVDADARDRRHQRLRPAVEGYSAAVAALCSAAAFAASCAASSFSCSSGDFMMPNSSRRSSSCSIVIDSSWSVVDLPFPRWSNSPELGIGGVSPETNLPDG